MGTLLLADALGAEIKGKGWGQNEGAPEKTDVLILQRWSPKPRFVTASKILVQAHDTPRVEYFPGIRAGYPLICVGAWQAAQFQAAFPGVKTSVIPPILGPHVAEAKGKYPRDPKAWVYPTAANKGLLPTLQKWALDPLSREAKLWVTTSGYDAPPRGQVERYGATYFPHESPLWLTGMIAQASGLYYVNTAPECFPMTVAIAKYLGLALKIECRGHAPCGIRDAIETDSSELSSVNVKRKWEALWEREAAAEPERQ
jgi:hypothetical protein